MTQAFNPSASAVGQAPTLNRKQRRQAERKARRLGGVIPGAQSVLDRARSLHAAGRLDEAEAVYRRLLSGHGNQPSVRSLLGALCLQRGAALEAVELLERASRDLPGDVTVHTNLGFAYSTLERPADADEAFGQALKLKPEDPEALKNVAGWLHQRNRFAEAKPLFEKALAKAPDDGWRWSLLAQCCAMLGESEAALEHATKARDLAPEDPRINAYLGMVLSQFGHYEDALTPILLGFPAMGHTADYQKTFATLLTCIDYASYRPEMEQPLLTCFASDKIDLQRLASTAGAHLWYRYMETARTEDSEDGTATRVHFDGVLADELLIALLSKAVNRQIGLEALLVPLRASLLGTLLAQPDASLVTLRFATALATQCHNSSYIYPTSAPETAEIDRLLQSVERRLAGGVEIDRRLEVDLALLAMYRPLHRLAGLEPLLAVPAEDWSSELRPLIALTLLDPAEEQALKPAIEAFGSIEDSVSRAVRSQYEENPYPRWTFLPKHKPSSLAEQIKSSAPWLALPESFDEPEDCLIAGCGTGRHPINAAAMTPNVRFLAIDLSLSSLAYAKRMALHHGIGNIDFMHGDLLEIASLGRSFSWIESAGVLHHMEDPERGLKSLLEILRPGGLLRLGLYSAIARRFIIEARQRIETLGLEPNAEDIREFRRRIVNREEPNIEHFMTLGDFFDLDSFRDLAFHVQEHQFTIPQMKDMLERHDLEFCGFIGLKPTIYRSFKERFPAAASETDMDCWAEFEEDNPNSFVGMYEYWCRRAA